MDDLGLFVMVVVVSALLVGYGWLVVIAVSHSLFPVAAFMVLVFLFGIVILGDS